jgi:hypothetical protein
VAEEKEILIKERNLSARRQPSTPEPLGMLVYIFLHLWLALPWSDCQPPWMSNTTPSAFVSRFPVTLPCFVWTIAKIREYMLTLASAMLLLCRRYVRLTWTIVALSECQSLISPSPPSREVKYLSRSLPTDPDSGHSSGNIQSTTVGVRSAFSRVSHLVRRHYHMQNEGIHNQLAGTSSMPEPPQRHSRSTVLQSNCT